MKEVKEMDKKKYTVLDMETIVFDSTDVIVTSAEKIANAQANEVLGDEGQNYKGDVMF